MKKRALVDTVDDSGNQTSPQTFSGRTKKYSTVPLIIAMGVVLMFLIFPLQLLFSALSSDDPSGRAMGFMFASPFIMIGAVIELLLFSLLMTRVAVNRKMRNAGNFTTTGDAEHGEGEVSVQQVTDASGQVTHINNDGGEAANRKGTSSSLLKKVNVLPAALWGAAFVSLTALLSLILEEKLFREKADSVAGLTASYSSDTVSPSYFSEIFGSVVGLAKFFVIILLIIGVFSTAAKGTRQGEWVFAFIILPCMLASTWIGAYIVGSIIQFRYGDLSIHDSTQILFAVVSACVTAGWVVYRTVCEVRQRKENPAVDDGKKKWFFLAPLFLYLIFAGVVLVAVGVGFTRQATAAAKMEQADFQAKQDEERKYIQALNLQAMDTVRRINQVLSQAKAGDGTVTVGKDNVEVRVGANPPLRVGTEGATVTYDSRPGQASSYSIYLDSPTGCSFDFVRNPEPTSQNSLGFSGTDCDMGTDWQPGY